MPQNQGGVHPHSAIIRSIAPLLSNLKRNAGLRLHNRRSARALRKLLAMTAAATFLLQQTALAAPPPTLPSGGNFVAGSGAISSTGNVLTVNQSSLRGIIDWNKFSIGQGGLVQFNNGPGATLNRVTGGAITSILGSLIASGSVYLINPEGVLIGPRGKVATGGDFVASTLNLSNSSFLNGGSLVFQGNSTALVKNLGAVSSSGGSVFLIARSVENGGSLKAATGSVGLGAGQQILLKDSTSDERVFVQAHGGDAANSGNIAAAEAEVKAAGGNIYALAGNNGGQIRATGTATKNGHVWLISDGGKTWVSTTISAKNADGTGGAIETSGQSVSTDGAHIKTGRGGSWLLDPDDLTIDSSLASTIQTALNGGTDVTEQTSAPTGGGNGDINVASNVAWNSGSSLTLSAYRNVTVNNGVTVSNTGAGNLTLRADNTANGTGAVTLNGNVNYSGSTGNISILYDPIGVNKYTHPVTYGSQVQTNGGVPNQLTAYMLVNNATDLQSVGTTGNYALGTNIDAGSIANFTPIAHSAAFSTSTDGFSGIFDGQGHTVANLKVNDSTDQSSGLFAQIASGGIVRNLGVTNANISNAYYNAGAIAGQNWGSISRAYSTGSVSATAPGVIAGGLVGSNDGQISYSYSTASVSGVDSTTLGGLAGWNALDSPSAAIANSYSTGAIVPGPTSTVGGLIGENDGPPGTISSSYWDTATSGQAGGVGFVMNGGSSGYTGLSTAQLQNGSLPTGFDSSAWITAPGHYPALGWQGQLVSGTVFSGSSPLGLVTVAGLVNGATIGSTTTNASGHYSFSLFPGSGTNVLTYLSGAGTGNTFSDGGTTGTYTGMNIYSGSLRLISGTKNTYSGMITALGTALGSNSGSNFLFTLNSGALSLTNATNLSILNSAASFSLDQSIAGPGSVFASAAGNLTLAAGKTFSGTGSGDALVLTTGGRFTNNAGSGGLSVAGLGRWLVYSQNPANDTLGSLAYNFKQYAASYGATTVAQASGNGVFYSYAPSLTIGLTGAVTKTYDATTNATLSSSNYSVSGAVSGDTVTLNNPAGGAYADKNAGIGKTVTVSGLAIASAVNGSASVYGYQLGSSSASGNVGVISAKQLSDTLTANNKIYDGTAAATGSLGSLTGVLGSDAVNVSGSAIYSFDTKNVGAGKTVTATGLSLAGTDAGNYTLGTLTGTADITPKPLSATLAASNKIYDGNNIATATPGALAGVAGADVVTLAGTGSYAFADKNVGIGKTVTESGLSLAGADAGNYTLAALTGTASIAAKQLTAAVVASNKIYDGTTAATATSGPLAGIVGSDDVSFTGIASYGFANKNVGTGKTVTETGLSLTGVDAGNYTLGVLTGAADITAKPLSATMTAVSKVYDGTAAAIASVNPLTGVAGADSVNLTGTASYAFSDKNVGTGKTVTVSGLTLTGVDAGNYTIGPVTGTADITAKQLTAALIAANKIYDGSAAAVGAVGGLTGVVAADSVSLTGTPTYVFANKNAGVGKTVTESGLALTGADAGNYTLGSLTGTADITARQLTAPVTAANKIYDGTTTAIATTGSLTGAVGGDDVSFSGTPVYNFSNKNVGTAKTVTESGVSLSGADAGNYTLSALTGSADIAPRQLTAAVTALDKVYDGTTVATADIGTLTGVVGSDSVRFAGSGSYAFSDKNAGSGKIVTESGLTLTGADAGNYSLNVQNGTANITPATISLAFSPNNKTYDGTTATTGSSGALSGVIGGDSVTLSGTAAYHFSDKNVGVAKVVTASGLTLSGADAADYQLNMPGSTASIAPATLNLSISANDKVYDGTTAANGTPGSLSGVFGVDDVTLSGTGSFRFSDKNVGTGKLVSEAGLSLGGTDAGNYILNVQNGAANITPAPLTTNIAAVGRVYDGTVAASGSVGALTGTIAGDDVALTGTAVYAFANKNAGMGKPVTASGLTLAGADAANYSLNVQPGAASISPAALTASLSASSKVYDGTTAATASLGSLRDVLGSDDVTLGGLASYGFSDKSVGRGKTVTASGLALSGTDAGNYTLTIQHGTADITPATLTASIIADNKIYDGTTAAAGRSGNLTGVLAADDVTLAGPATYMFTDKNVGAGKIVGESGLTLAGSDAANYLLNVQNGQADIAPATLVVTSDHASRPFGDQNPAFTGTVTGFVSGETLASATSGNLAFTSPATIASAAGTYAINGSGLAANNGNYLFEQALGNATALTVASVGSQPPPAPKPTPRPIPIPTQAPVPTQAPGPSGPVAITISINNATRLANQPNPKFSATYTGPALHGLDVASLLAQLAFQTEATTTSKPGVYSIVAAGRVPGYVFDIQPGTLTVVDSSPKTIPTQVAVQPATAPVAAHPAAAGNPVVNETSTADGSGTPSLPTASPVGPNMLGNFDMNYSVNWSKLLDSSLSQSKPIAESSFVSPGPDQKTTVKSYSGGAAH